MRIVRCRSCESHWVPNVLLATVEPPPGLAVTGPGLFIEARVLRRKDARAVGEAECSKLSEELVFLEYALHQQLLLKMRRE